MRICKRCGRPLEDKDYHDITVLVPSLPPVVGFYRGQRVYGEEPVGKGRRFYACKVKLIANRPDTGKRFVPGLTDRIDETNTRYVPEDVLELEAYDG